MHAIRYAWRVLIGLEDLSTQKRLTIVLGAYIVYILLFLVVFQLPWIERSVVIFAIIPIYLAAILFGLPGGIISSLFTIVINPVLFFWMQPENGFFGEKFWTMHLALVIIGLSFGYLNRMRKKLNREYEERQKMEFHLKHLATHDSLTDLPNRAMFDEFLKSALARARRQHEGLAVLVIDLDDFKTVNDLYGHAAGDYALQELGFRLNRSLRTTDQVARIGGDEFIAFIEGSNDKYIIARICERLLYNANQPLNYDDNELHLSLSIGISRYPDDANTPEDLIRLADLAMYEVKQTKEHIYSFYQKSTDNE